VTVRVARWSATHPWRAIGLWVLFVAVCFAVAGGTGLREAKQSDLGTGESGRAAKIVDAGNFADPAVENVLITAPSGKLDQGASVAAARDVAARMRKLAEVESVGEPVPAPNGDALLVPVTMKGEQDSASDRVEPLLNETKAAQQAHPDLRIEEVGGASIGHGLDDALGSDFEKAEFLSLPVTLIILLLAFGAIIAAGVPVLLALSSVVAAIGLSTLASQVFPDSGSTKNVILLMGMAVGVDYSLFYLKREREERQRLGNRPGSHVNAVEIAAATSGHAVVVSGLAVLVSMAGLYLSNDGIFASLATGSIIVVAVAVLGSLTVLPALLAKLGRWVDRPRIPFLWRLTARQGPPRVWPKLLQPALKHPVATLLVSVIALGALALPALGMKLQHTTDSDLPRTIPVMQSYDRLTAAFPSKGTHHLVEVRTASAHPEEIKAGLQRLVDRTKGDPLFAENGNAQPEIKISKDGTVGTVEVATPFTAHQPEAKQSLAKLREQLVPATLGSLPGVEHAVTGDIAWNLDSTDNLQDKLPWVMGFVLALTFVMMAWNFRSIVIAITALGLNLLSVAAAFGVLTLVFQHSWAESLLHFHSTGSIVAWLPLFLFVVLFGLSMDYHVFVVSRIREAAMRGMSTKDAVAYGITRSAGVVTSAAIVMVSVFAIFATLSLVEMKEMGIGLATAVFLDAMVIRILVLPSIMALLGRANWWPSRGVKRAQQQVGAAAEVRPGVPQPVR
jgi:RND superfamily putative drug exporter